MKVLKSTMGTKSPLQLVSIMLHGTATPLGDPIEVAALASALSSKCSYGMNDITPFNGTYLSAPKSTLGHAEGASGLHSFLAVLTTLEHQINAPVAHLRHLSAHVLPVVRKSRKVLSTPIQTNGVSEMPDKATALGSGCSAFGLSGVNSHAVMAVQFDAVSVCSLDRKGFRKGILTRAWPHPYFDGLLDKPRLISENFLRGGASASFLKFDVSNGTAFADLYDHRICDTILLPAATALCLAASAARSCLNPRLEKIDITVADVIFALPVHLGKTSTKKFKSSKQTHPQAVLSCTLSPCGVVSIHDGAIKGNIKLQGEYIVPNYESRRRLRQLSKTVIDNGSVEPGKYVVAQACRSLHIREVGENHSINSHGISSQMLDSVLHLGFELNVQDVRARRNKSVTVPTSLYISVMKEAHELSSLTCSVFTSAQDSSRITDHTASSDGKLTTLSTIHGLQTKSIVTSALQASSRTTSPETGFTGKLKTSTYSTELFATSHYKDETMCLRYPRCAYAVKSTLSHGERNIDSCAVEDPVYSVCSTLSVFQQLCVMPKSTKVAVLLEDTGSTGSTMSPLVEFARLSSNAAVDGIAQTSSLENGEMNKVTCVRRDPRCVNQITSQENGSVAISRTVFRPTLLPANVLSQQSKSDLLSLSETTEVKTELRDIVNRAFSSELQTSHATTLPWRQLSAANVRTFTSSCAGLITGGTGALGRLVQFWFSGNRLSSRSCLTGRTGRSSFSLQGAGITVTLKCDASQRSEAQCCSEMMNSPHASLMFPNANTILLHASGTLSDAIIQNQQVHRVRNAMVPKVCALSELMQRSVVGSSRPFTASVVFSSVAALLGSAGQSNYVAANMAVDALVLRRRLSGKAEVSIQWGAWKEAGMAARDETTLSRVERLGVRAMSSEHGLTILNDILEHCIAEGFLAKKCQNCIIAASIFDWQLITENVHPMPSKCSAMLSLICESLPNKDLVHDADEEEEHILDDERMKYSLTREHSTLVSGTSSQFKQDEIHEIITKILIDLTGTIGIDPETPFMSAGIDSLASMRLKSELEKTFDFQMSATTMYDYPTITALTLHVFTELGGKAPDVQQMSHDLHTNNYVSSLKMRNTFVSNGGREILVTGSSLRTPAVERKTDQLTPWDSMSRVPRARWDMQAYVDSVEKCLPFLGGFMEYVEMFDSTLFGIAQIEALLMDTQHRQLLEMFVHAYSVKECTMCSRIDALVGEHTGSAGSGAFVGIADQSYQHRYVFQITTFRICVSVLGRFEIPDA
jgi:acyl carrier protein